MAWAAWRWAPLIAGDGWHEEYGVEAGVDVHARQLANLAALLDGYQPTGEQRAALPAAIHAQMTSHAADLEEMAATDPAFAELVARGYARDARRDAAWWSASIARPDWQDLFSTPPGRPRRA